MYQTAFQVFRQSLGFLLPMALLIEAVNLAFDISGGFTLVLGAMLAFYFHRAVLLGNPYTFTDFFKLRATDGQNWLNWSFCWRFGVLLLIPGIVFIAMLVGLLYIVGLDHTPTDSETLGAALVAIVPGALVFLPIAALVGTMLPAAAIEADASMGRAFQRGKKTFGVTLWRLFSGSCLYTLFLTIAMALCLGFLNAQAPILAANQIASFLINTLLSLLGFFTPLLTATALSMAYRTGEERLADQQSLVPA